ncbi:hypothetical protein [Acidovorax sp. Leaf160]|uniref:hypothetical protein n=1 Tax=Acidovorax sp. Leaf160 TaxID=1736280 RepID=UPI0007002C38|nr:hypothetical protein [Acidovorax sp. Leaf160]KQR55650.1 hypothetical protein ASF94_04425 [Acidovorax sp. Leaf160]
MSADATLTALRKRLSRWELDHLRSHCAELATKLDSALERIEQLEAENARAWEVADSWYRDAMQLVDELNDEGKAVGLTVSGSLVVMPPIEEQVPA